MKTIYILASLLFTFYAVNAQDELKHKLEQLAKEYENANFH